MLHKEKLKIFNLFVAVKREVKPSSFFFLFTRYTHAHHVPHAEHVFTGQQAK